MDKEKQVTSDSLSLCRQPDQKLEFALFYSTTGTSTFIFFCSGHVGIGILICATKGELKESL